MAMSFGSFASRVVATRVLALDGTGDFTDIQSAIDDLPSGGGVVYIREGTYTISSTISITKSNVTIKGAGNSTIIYLANNSDVDMISVSSHDYFSITDVHTKCATGETATLYCIGLY